MKVSRGHLLSALLPRAALAACVGLGIGPAQTIPDDLEALEARIGVSGARLLILDPLLGQFSESVDTHRDQDLRRTLSLVNKMAERTGIAVIGIRHHTKDENNRNPLSRGLGGIAVTANARSLLVAGKYEGQHVLAHAKCNLAPLAKSLAYKSDPVRTDVGEISRVKLLGEVDVTASDLLAAKANPGPDPIVSDKAQELILQKLEAGPLGRSDLVIFLEGKRIAKTTAYRAVNDLRKAELIRERTDDHWELTR